MYHGDNSMKRSICPGITIIKSPISNPKRDRQEGKLDSERGLLFHLDNIISLPFSNVILSNLLKHLKIIFFKKRWLIPIRAYQGLSERLRNS